MCYESVCYVKVSSYRNATDEMVTSAARTVATVSRPRSRSGSVNRLHFAYHHTGRAAGLSYTKVVAYTLCTTMVTTNCAFEDRPSYSSRI